MNKLRDTFILHFKQVVFVPGQVAVICVTRERISVKETSYKFNSSYNAKQFNLTSHDFDTYNHTQLNHTLSNISSTASLTNVTRISNTTSKNLTLENVNISISNFLFQKHIPESHHERETVAISFKKASCQTNHYVTKTEDTEIIFNLTECLNGTQKSVSTFNYTKTSHAVVLTNYSETARGDLSVKKLLSKIEWQNVSTTLNSFSVTTPFFTFSQQSLVTITLDSVITMNTSSYFRTEFDGGKATTPHYKVSMNTNPMRSTDSDILTRKELSTTVTKPSNKRVSAKSLLQTNKELTTHQSVLNRFSF